MAKSSSKVSKTSSGTRRSSNSTRAMTSAAERMLAKQRAAASGKKAFVTIENPVKGDPSKLMVKIPYVGKFGAYIQDK